MIPVNPMSFPPICSVTTFVPVPTAFSCGGFVRALVSCGAVMSSVVAPLQDTSVSV